MNFRRTTASIAIALSLGFGGVALTEPAQAAPISHVTPASASSGRQFVVVGSLGDYYAHHFINGEYVGSSKKYFFKSSATHEGICWAAGC